MDRLNLCVLLATSSPIIRTFFAQLADEEDGLWVVHVLPVAVAALREQHEGLAAADVAVVEMEAADQLVRAIRFCDELRGERPNLPIMALVHGPRDVALWHVGRLFGGELHGLCDLRATTGEMRTVLRELAAGAVVVRLQGDPEHFSVLRDALTGRRPLPVPPVRERGARLLTGDDRWLLERVARGWSDAALAAELHASARTVRHRLERVKRELGVTRREELAAWAGAHGLYQPTVPPAAA